MSVMSKVFKYANHPGVLAYWAAASAIGGVKAAANTVDTLGTSYMQQDPQTFEKTGYAAGEVVGQAGWAFTDAIWLGHGIRRYGAQEGWKWTPPVGVSQNFLKEGASKEVLTLMKTQGEAGHVLEGVITGKGKFLKNMSGLGVAGMIAAPLLMEMAARPVLGFVGKLMDETYNERRRMTEINYDTRFFNTDRQDASTYQQVGAAMNAYQNKMVSLARIYHAR